MAYTCKHINVSELEAIIDSNDFKQLYDDSAEKIENGNYDLYNSESELSDDDKYFHWVSLMKSCADRKVLDQDTQTHYLLAVYKDGDLCLLSANYYDSADNSYNYCHALLKLIDNSKAWAFQEDFWIPQTALMKSLGADKMVFYSTQGGSLSFRSKTAQGIPALFDYENHIQTEEEKVFDIDSKDIEVAPTEDGSTQMSNTIKLLQQSTTTVKTVRPLK